VKEGDITTGGTEEDPKPTQPTERGEWVSINEAATRLKKSERTIHRTLTKRRGPGGRTQVWVPADQEAAALAIPEPPDQIKEQMQAMHASYMDRLTALAEENGRLRAENEELRRRLDVEVPETAFRRLLRRLMPPSSRLYGFDA
jgi:DNA-binding transcriptional regulator PaaX